MIEGGGDLTRRRFLSTLAVGAGAVALGSCSGQEAEGPGGGSATPPPGDSTVTTPAVTAGIAAPFRPPAGQVYLIAGQKPEALGGQGPDGPANGYLDRVELAPAGITRYRGFPAPGEAPYAAFANPDPLLDSPRLESSLLHLSINWGEGDPLETVSETEVGILDGDFDWYLDAMADWMDALRRPIILRLGYEFDRPILQLATQEHFADVFRYVVDRLRDRDVPPFATAWASANLTLDPDVPVAPFDFDAWYPGDDHVDWFGYSMWFPSQPDRQMMEQARARNKPIILAETTPVQSNVGDMTVHPGFAAEGRPDTPDELWASWWQPMIDFVDDNVDVIGAWHYIANDWAAEDPFWSTVPLFAPADGHLWANDEMLVRWDAAMASGLFVAPTPGLFAS